MKERTRNKCDRQGLHPDILPGDPLTSLRFCSRGREPRRSGRSRAVGTVETPGAWPGSGVTVCEGCAVLSHGRRLGYVEKLLFLDSLILRIHFSTKNCQQIISTHVSFQTSGLHREGTRSWDRELVGGNKVDRQLSYVCVSFP